MHHLITIALTAGFSVLAQAQEISTKTLTQNCKLGKVEACARLAGQANDDVARASWLWRGCSLAPKAKSTPSMLACVDLSRRPNDWDKYGVKVEALFKELCRQGDAAGACISLGSLARGGKFDPPATTQFLESECKKKNGGGCYGLFTLMVKRNAGDETTFSVPESAIRWLQQACDLNHHDSCELLNRARLNTSSFKF